MKHVNQEHESEDLHYAPDCYYCRLAAYRRARRENEEG